MKGDEEKGRENSQTRRERKLGWPSPPLPLEKTLRRSVSGEATSLCTPSKGERRKRKGKG